MGVGLYSCCNPGVTSNANTIYENEMLAILHVVDLWRPYLLWTRFQIKTDHQSIKYFLEQRLFSLEKQKWVTKLFGYDYERRNKVCSRYPVFQQSSQKRKSLGCEILSEPNKLQNEPKKIAELIL